MTRVEEIVEQVRALSPDEQEEVWLLLSHGADADFESSDEWKEEINRRAAELESGRVKGIPWEDVERKLERRLRGGSWD